MKIPFDIKFRPQIESGEYKVFAHEHEEQEARIVCWDNKGGYPIVALIDNEPEKFDKHGRVPGGNRGEEFSLFIITPKPELSEFEQEYIRLYKEGYADGKAGSKPISDDNLKEYAAELLNLARKELCEQIVNHTKGAYEIGDWIYHSKYGPAQICAIDEDFGDEPEVTVKSVNIKHKNGYEYGYCADLTENVFPIPITPEILEKNFEKKTFLGIFDDYFDLTIREYSDSIYIVDYHCCEMNLPDQSVMVGYVHELQHALRLCKIDKEIVL